MVSDRFLEVRSTLGRHCATKRKDSTEGEKGPQNVE
jgi:hypothetical protein